MPIKNAVIPLDRLLCDERNPKRHSAENIKRLVARIQAVGFTAPVLVDERTGILAAGHRRRLALHWLRENHFAEPEGIDPGWGVPARVGEWSEIQALQVLIGDNEDPQELDFDTEALTALLADLAQAGALEGSGYDEARLESLIEELAAEGGSAGESGLLADADPDAVPESAPSRCQSGDLWQLGRHRLLCGDSTSADDVARLMDGEQAAMVFTDPPYNTGREQGRTQSAWGVITNDAMSEDAFTAFLSSYRATLDRVAADAAWYVCCHWKSYTPMFAAMEPVNACIVWAKNNFGLGENYRPQHEFILFRGKIKANDQSDLWHIAKDASSAYKHPTQKPTALVAKAIENSSSPNGLLFDGFLGSGTTMLAAEQLGRRCYGLELEPGYCDVILARWEAATGQTATLLERIEN